MEIISKRLLLATLCSLSLLTGCASTYEDGLSALQEGEPAKAQEIWLALAEEGNVDAMYGIYDLASSRYNRVSESDIEWLKKAADAGMAKAQYQYGLITFNDQHFAKGHQYIKQAAAQGQPEAAKFIERYKPTIKTFLLAEKGNRIAEYNLGVYYDNGIEGLDKDNKEAASWYLKAANQNHPSAQNNLGIMYENGIGVKQSNSEAFKWYQKAAKQGAASGQFNLADMYESGRGVKRDYVQAKSLYEQAAVQGLAGAQNQLGNLYRDGKGVKKDAKKST